MCLIGALWQPDEGTLRVAANRDEFHARPTASADWWPEARGDNAVFGGRDLRAGGGWLAVSLNGRLAAVTNIRRADDVPAGAPSRGALVADFLRSPLPAAQWLADLGETAAHYAGCNLLVFDGRHLMHACNRPEWRVRDLAPGVHVFSNANLDTEWPKTRRLRDALEAEPTREVLFAALADTTPAPDEALPDTGVGLPMERMLSPPFICSPHYGTRASTIVDIDGKGRIDFEERRFNADGTANGTTRETLP